MSFSKAKRRQRIHWRIREKVKGTAARPRLSVYRSNRDIYCQAIDDVNGHTLFAASSREASVSRETKPVERAKQVGQLIAERAKEHNIEKVVFDRSGYLYHGRVKALAEGAREGGLKF
ncbi:MAG: 50S ribosomal protein L18 [Lewinellaceae bacterium]|nr:50S ribosomal protein L18 [Phaeodactylibacter sp.]MCB9039195.1 50S ribosomal protein L18 [Lewinellaceae bacterium]